jgi:riboflavin kinase/FMN adenylyltransferase
VIVFHAIDDFPAELHGGAVAIGNFDGVHRGHAQLVERLRTMAEGLAGPAVVFTFDPPPARVLNPALAPEPLLWTERKIELLAEMGVQAAIVYPTDRALLELDAREFFERIVRGRLAARGMVEGPNFFFGRGRSGNVEVLRQFCAAAAMPFEVVEAVEIDGLPVSSSRIRALVLESQMYQVRAMLGRPHRIRGLVVRGAGRGTKLGFPTANLERIDVLLPGQGIYAARAKAPDAWHPAAVSIGPNPTFDEGSLKIEVHLLDFAGDLYDQTLEVDFLAKLRDTERFASVEELLARMRLDIQRTREICAAK